MRRTIVGLACAALLMFGCAEGTDEGGGEDPGSGSAETAANWVAELPEGDPATGLPSGEMRTIEATDEAVQAGQSCLATGGRVVTNQAGTVLTLHDIDKTLTIRRPERCRGSLGSRCERLLL